MITNLALPDEDRPACHAAALCVLLARADLSDICTWTVGAEGVSGQLSAVYTDAEAYHRLDDLAGCLTGGRLVTHPTRGDGDTSYTPIEALGTVEGAPVRFWTHLHDRDALGEVSP